MSVYGGSVQKIYFSLEHNDLMSRGLFENVIKLCESRGFSIESCIEGSLGKTYTYHFGPLGTELRRNLKNAWWFDVVLSKANVYGFETSTTPAPKSQSVSSPALSDSENGKDQGSVIREPGLSNKCSFPEKHSWTYEDTNNLTQLVRFVPGINVPFGVARNIKYLWKPDNDKYILRYVAF